MGFKEMKRRLEADGGVSQQDRMVRDKLLSLRHAIANSYQGARFISMETGEEFPGLFNSVTVTENYDTKLISAESQYGLKGGSYFKWDNTGTTWIVYTTDRTELAYFIGKARLCNYTIKWVDADRELVEVPVSVIGSNVTSLRTATSTTAKVVQDVPNANTSMLLQDNEVNRRFFSRYQTVLIEGVTFRLEETDCISMPGVIQAHLIEHYGNSIEDDVEENIRNAWNVMPIVPDSPTDFLIEGDIEIFPQSDVVYTTSLRGGQWVIVENTEKESVPARILTDPLLPEVTVHWNSGKSGMFTLGYLTGTGTLHQKSIVVLSLF